MKTIICKHDDRGFFEVIGTDGEPVRLILLEDDHIGEANITVDGNEMIGYEYVVERKPELIKDALENYTKTE